MELFAALTVEQVLGGTVTTLGGVVALLFKKYIGSIQGRLTKVEKSSRVCEEDRQNLYLALADTRKQSLREVKNTVRVLRDRWENESDLPNE